MINSLFRFYGTIDHDPNIAKEDVVRKYLDEFVIGHNPNVDPLCFFESVESFLRKKGEVKQPKKRQRKRRSRKRKSQQTQSNPIAGGKPETPDVQDTDDIPSVEPNPTTEDSVPVITESSEPVEEPQEVQDALSNARSLRIKDVIEHLENDAPEDLKSWFKQHYSGAFIEENLVQVFECITSFQVRLRKEIEEVNLLLINEWLFYVQVLRVMMEKWNFNEVQTEIKTAGLDERQRQCRRLIAQKARELPQSAVSAFISV